MNAPARRTIPELDGLRGVAILLVFLAHFVAFQLPPQLNSFDGDVQWIVRFGWTGVDLFFVLSGFLITGVLLDTKGQPRYWRNYVARRCLRIFPLYYGALVLILIVLPAVTHWSDDRFLTLRANQAWYWTYTVNFMEVIKGPGSAPLNTSHFWSLCIEEQFYLLWPLVVLLVPRRAILHIAVGAGVFGIAFRWWLVHSAPDSSAPYILTPGRLDGLMIGAVLAVQQRDGGLERLRPLANRVWRTASALVIGLALWRGMDYRDPVMAVLGFPAVAAAYGGLLVLALTGPGDRLRRFLSLRPLRSWGKYSYGLYLIHYPLLGALNQKLGGRMGTLMWLGSHMPGVVVIALVGVPLAYALAWCSYHVYEKPFLSLKRYFE